MRNFEIWHHQHKFWTGYTGNCEPFFNWFLRLFRKVCSFIWIRRIFRLNVLKRLHCLPRYILLIDSILKSSCCLNFNETLFSQTNITVANSAEEPFLILSISWRRFLSYRNQSTDFFCESMDWFLYDRNLRHERVEHFQILP